jgi:hypothetical protein
MSTILSRGLRAATLIVGCAAAGVAFGQAPAQPRDPNMPDPRNTIPEKIEPNATGTTLSERLERTDGVIAPPATSAPDMRVPAPVPDPGTTPVIRPPGEPGGNQAIQPK